MALMTPRTLVLSGVSVLRDGTAVQTRLGLGYQGDKQAPAPFSMRHPSPHAPRGETEPEPRRVVDDFVNRDVRVVKRAGRPGCWAGVPVRQGRTSPMAAGRIGSAIATAAAALDRARPGRLQTGSATNLRTAGALAWRPCSQEGKCRTGLPALRRAGEASTPSTRGEGAE
jgi:hypothetical protein